MFSNIWFIDIESTNIESNDLGFNDPAGSNGIWSNGIGSNDIGSNGIGSNDKRSKTRQRVKCEKRTKFHLDYFWSFETFLCSFELVAAALGPEIVFT